MVPNQECLLCAGADETVSHLFFQCAVSKECFEGIKKWLQWRSPKLDILESLECIAKQKKYSNFKEGVLRAAVAAGVYHIWSMRNLRL